MDKLYWEEYYSVDKNINLEPSPFAKYIYNNFLKQTDNIIELGCGTGRDALYFSRNNINIVAIENK